MSTLLSTRRSVIAITALVVPLAFTAASANAQYLYVGDYDPYPTTETHVYLPINAQTLGSFAPEHSLFEIGIQYPWGGDNSIEVGVTTDLIVNGDRNPHWFVWSTVNGAGNYDALSGFVSEIGTFWTTSLASVEGTSAEVELEYNAPNWWLYLNGAAAGYFPGTLWSGAFTTAVDTQVFGEVTYDGTSYATMNGTVSGYGSSGGGQLVFHLADYPYVMSNASPTGFTASGPVPEPSAFQLLISAAAGLSAYVLRRRRAKYSSWGQTAFSSTARLRPSTYPILRCWQSCQHNAW